MKEERKELKEKLKKQIDELSDEELDKVAGGIIKNVEWITCEKCGERYPKTRDDDNCPYCNSIIISG